MKVIKFWLEIAKRFLAVWDEVTTEMGYSPFASKPKKQVTKTNGDSK